MVILWVFYLATCFAADSQVSFEIDSDKEKPGCLFSDLREKEEYIETELSNKRMKTLLSYADISTTLTNRYESSFDQLAAGHIFQENKWRNNYQLAVNMTRVYFDTASLPLDVASYRRVQVVDKNRITAGWNLKPLSGYVDLTVQANKLHKKYWLFGEKIVSPHGHHFKNVRLQFQIPVTKMVFATNILLHHVGIPNYHLDDTNATTFDHIEHLFQHLNATNDERVSTKYLLPLLHRIYEAKIDEVAIRPKDMELSLNHFAQAEYEALDPLDPAYELNHVVQLIEQLVSEQFRSGVFYTHMTKQLEAQFLAYLNSAIVAKLKPYFTPGGCLTDVHEKFPWFTSDEKKAARERQRKEAREQQMKAMLERQQKKLEQQKPLAAHRAKQRQRKVGKAPGEK